MIPSSLLPYLPSEQAHTTFLKSQQYAADTLAFKGRMGMLDQLESFILLTSVAASTYVYLGLGHATSTPWPFLGKDGTSWTLLKGFWDLSARLIPASFATTEIRHSMAFVLLLTTLGTLTSLPKAYYKNFVLEENHGFNKMTRQTFFADQVKGESSPWILSTLILIYDERFLMSRILFVDRSRVTHSRWNPFHHSTCR